MDDQEEIEVVFQVIRENADATGYGSWISDDFCRELAVKIIEAIDNARKDTP